MTGDVGPDPIRAEDEGGQGFLTLLPWLILSAPVVVGETAFVPVTAKTARRRLLGATGATVAALLRRHRDARGHRLPGLTVALHRRNGAWSWKTQDDQAARERVNSDRQILALACLAEQEFFRGGAHINGAMFAQAVQGMVPGTDGITLVKQRRDGQTLDGGWDIADVTLQAPPIIPHDTCPAPSGGLLPALVAARAAAAPAWERIDAALPFFILGASELPELASDGAAMLLALAFERLLDPEDSKAHLLARAFAEAWEAFGHITLAAARLKPDAGEHADAQLAGPVRRKWMKELYEARNSYVHHRLISGRSSNWTAWQHVIAASFAFPLTVKLLLVAEGHYALSVDDEVSCGILDRLLVEGFKVVNRHRGPDWPRILNEARWGAHVQRSVKDAAAQVATGGLAEGSTGNTKKAPKGRRR